MSNPVARLNAALVFVLVLAPFFSACASSGGAASGGTADADGGSSTLIVRAQLQRYAGQSALDAIQRFNRRWLRPERGGGGTAYARVVIDGGSWYSLNVLDQLSANDVVFLLVVFPIFHGILFPIIFLEGFPYEIDYPTES